MHRLKFGGTLLHWPKPSDKCDISLKKKPCFPPLPHYKSHLVHNLDPKEELSQIMQESFTNHLSTKPTKSRQSPPLTRP
jgi:hypothetical protein